jgi:hypothetical protein
MQNDSSDACADILTLTREQLYDRVWDEPAYMLAPQLGVSDVALAKTCKRLGIPKPSRGCWARLATGQRMQKDKLPPAKPNQRQIVQFHVADNLKRRDEAKKASQRNSSVESWPEQLSIPESETTLHPIAERLMAKIQAAKPTEDGRVRIRSANFSDIVCSPMSAFRVAGALHVIASHLEPRGIRTRIGKDSDAVVQFLNEQDAVGLRMEEEIEEIERVPSVEEKRRPSWEWQTKVRQPSGRLMLHLYSAQRIPGRKQWSETSTRQLEKILPMVISRIVEVFHEFSEDRKREEQRRLDQIEREQRWQEEQKQRQHRDRLQEVTKGRAQLLRRAVQWWQVHQADLEFIAACERYWRDRQKGQLNEEQERWLAWARKQTDSLSPFSTGYPDPALDGSFNVADVPLGGPYPIVRQMTDPAPFQYLERERSYYSHARTDNLYSILTEPPVA